MRHSLMRLHGMRQNYGKTHRAQTRERDHRRIFLEKLAIDFAQKTISARVLRSMKSKRDISKDEYLYIIKKGNELREREARVVKPPKEDVKLRSGATIESVKEEPIAASPKSATYDIEDEEQWEQLKREIMEILRLTKDDQQIIDDLPEILGFKFCPRLFVDSGLLPPLEGDFVPMDYELAWMQLMGDLIGSIEAILSDPIAVAKSLGFDENNVDKSVFPQLITEIYALLPGGLTADGKDINPVFPRNLWLNALGFRLELESPDTLIGSILFGGKDHYQEVIALQKKKVNEAIATISTSIAEAIEAEQAAMAPIVDEGIADVVVEDNIEPMVDFVDMSDTPTDIIDPISTIPQLPDPVPSEIPAPVAEPFYKKTGNQVGMVLAALVVGYFMFYKKSPKKPQVVSNRR